MRDLPAGGGPAHLRPALAPVATLVTRAEVTELAALLARINAKGAPEISVVDFIVRAAAVALRENPRVNSLIEGNSIAACAQVNVGITVVRDEGTIVPVIRDADTLTVRQISECARNLASRARSGTLPAEERGGGAFTITDLGPYGITELTPPLTPPQGAALGVGAIEEACRTIEGVIQSRRVISLCLTHDGLIGVAAATFLARVRSLLEDPYALLA